MTTLERMKKNKQLKTTHHVRQTPYGPIDIQWSIHGGQPKILRIALLKPRAATARSSHTLFGSEKADTCAEIDKAADLIEAFLNSEDVHFPLEILRMDTCSDFQQKVLLAEYGIPRGQVSTYGLIAAFLGRPLAARAVGIALAENPFPIFIPCHRAVRSDRTLGGYQGGRIMKRALLVMEGIRFDATGRIIANDFYYCSSSLPTFDNKTHPLVNYSV
jgi:methylated-DNA-[protein]-cysteine S-methyltransferase